jgi:hypothetical protein
VEPTGESLPEGHAVHAPLSTPLFRLYESAGQENGAAMQKPLLLQMGVYRLRIQAPVPPVQSLFAVQGQAWSV